MKLCWGEAGSSESQEIVCMLSEPSPLRRNGVQKKNELKIYISWELVMLLHTKNKKNIAIVSRAPLCVVSNYHKLKLKLRHISHQIASKQIYTQKTMRLIPLTSVNFVGLISSLTILHVICVFVSLIRAIRKGSRRRSKKSVDAVDHLVFGKIRLRWQNVPLRRRE